MGRGPVSVRFGPAEATSGAGRNRLRPCTWVRPTVGPSDPESTTRLPRVAGGERSSPSCRPTRVAIVRPRDRRDSPGTGTATFAPSATAIRWPVERLGPGVRGPNCRFRSARSVGGARLPTPLDSQLDRRRERAARTATADGDRRSRRCRSVRLRPTASSRPGHRRVSARPMPDPKRAPVDPRLRGVSPGVRGVEQPDADDGIAPWNTRAQVRESRRSTTATRQRRLARDRSVKTGPVERGSEDGAPPRTAEQLSALPRPGPTAA